MKLLSRKCVFMVICVHDNCEAPNKCPRTETLCVASTSFKDYSAAISYAEFGDTVLGPAGSEAWNSPLTITQGIILMGDGADSTISTCSGPDGIYMLVNTPSKKINNADLWHYL